MRPFALIICLTVLIAIPASSYAIGIEVGLGAWQQDPQGHIAYKGADIDLEGDLKYDAETRVIGRVKIDMPLLIPNIYLMYTPMSFAGAGSKDISFTFGDKTFSATAPITSELTLDHYDIALFYGIPFLRTATAGVLNVDVGLNARVIEFEAKLDQNTANIHESKSMTLPVPMAYVGAQIKPIKKVAIEAEARGISYSGNQLISLIGRLKVKPIGPLFIAGGYRHDTLKVEEEDIKADLKFKGPFAEAGFEF